MSSLAEARRALLVNAVVVVVVILLFFFVGSAVFAYYQQAGGMPELKRQDQLLPHFVATDLRMTGLTGLLLAGLFAAAMSTLDSGINSLTAVVVCDWLPGRRLSVGHSRALSIVFGVLVIGAALVVPHLGEHVIGIITTIAGTFLGLLLGLFVLGMFFHRAGTGAALVGLAAGVVCFLGVLTQTTIAHWWYGAYTFFPTVLVGALASYVSPAAPAASREEGSS